MKRHIITIFLLLITVISFAYGEEPNDTKPISIGLGVEMNMNSRENFAGGAVLSFNYGFIDVLAAGVSFTANTNFDGITVLEPTVLFRWYILGKNYLGLFAQADIGVSIILEDSDADALFLGGLRGGFRFPLGEMFFIEPYGRLGYPFMFGIGVMAGVRF